MPEDNAPNTTTGNPFSLLAYIVFKVRHALEDQEDTTRPPRWVRIARGAKYKDEVIGKGVGYAVQGLADSVTLLAELTLDLEELLYQTDAAKAVAEVVLKMVSALGDDQFKNGVAAIFADGSSGTPPALQEVNSVLSQIKGAVTDIERVLKYIPEPEDVRSLGHEFYRLMCLVQREFPRDPDSGNVVTSNAALKDSSAQIDIEQIGKIWPCIWAYNDGAKLANESDLKHVEARGLGSDEQGEVELRFFGLRRLWSTTLDDLPAAAKLVWKGDVESVPIYDHNFDQHLTDNPQAGVRNISRADLKELVSLLAKHGYNTPALDAATANWSDIKQNLMKFQFLNEIPVSGVLDNATLNRLLNLDYDQKSLRRAVPFSSAATFPWKDASPPTRDLAGSLLLINPGAEDFAAEGNTVQSKPGSPYDYYVVPSSPAGKLPNSIDNWGHKQGWLSEANGARAFVALRSRARNPVAGDTPPSGQSQDGRFVGGLYSEGEAAFGAYFWAARHTEPWRPGRTGTPGADALFGGQKPQPESEDGPVISRMFQWVSLPAGLKPNTPPVAGLKLYMYASALQRSLFSDRNGGGYADQGSIRLEVHRSATPLNMPTSTALAAAATEWFPSHGLTAAAMDIALVDRQRLWVLRRTDRVLVADDAQAVCLIVEGRYQSAYDIDAYFDDFKLEWEWRAES